MEDDRWAERGKFDRQQDGWQMTAEWGGVSMTAGRKGENLTAISVNIGFETSFKSLPLDPPVLGLNLQIQIIYFPVFKHIHRLIV